MKKVFTIILTLFTLPLLAQVTIDQSNFTRTAGYVDSYVQASITGVSMPTEGTGQTWMYPGLQAETSGDLVWTAAAGDPDFPNALNVRPVDLIFASYDLTGRTYEGLDAAGWYDAGFYLNDTTYSITPITGGPNDILHFPAQAMEFEGRVNFLDFPVSFGKTWTQSRVEYTHFNLTVAAFSLNNTPGMQKRIFTQTRTVVGEGTLVIPDENGNPSGALDALLIKITNTTDTDSLFLGGQPAPEPLISAFGQVQGQVTERDDFYVFYVPGFSSVAVNVNLDASGNISSVFYRPAAAAQATSVADMDALASVNAYPNPVAAGQTLTLMLGENTKLVSYLELVDVVGRTMATQAVPANSQTVRFHTPSNLVPGIYNVVLRNSNNVPQKTTRVVVQ